MRYEPGLEPPEGHYAYAGNPGAPPSRLLRWDPIPRPAAQEIEPRPGVARQIIAAYPDWLREQGLTHEPGVTSRMWVAARRAALYPELGS